MSDLSSPATPQPSAEPETEHLIYGLSDRDWSSLVDYLANELPPAERAEVERRLREDPEFTKSAQPIIALWSVKIFPLDPLLDGSVALLQKKSKFFCLSNSQFHV